MQKHLALLTVAVLLIIGVYSNNHSWPNYQAQPINSSEVGITHDQLVQRLGKYLPKELLTLDIAEEDARDVPGYILLNARQSPDKKMLATTYITDCSKDLWSILEDTIFDSLPPGITKVKSCSWDMRLFVKTNNQENEITFNLPKQNWKFIPTVQAGGCTASPLAASWSPTTKQLVSRIIQVGESECGAFNTEWAVYDINTQTWRFLPDGVWNKDFTKILITTKNTNNMPSCAESTWGPGGPYLSPTMVALWDVESMTGKVLQDKNLSLYKIETVNWDTKTTQVRRYIMNNFVTTMEGKECIDYKFVVEDSTSDFSKVPSELITVQL